MKATIGLVGCGRWGENILRDLVAMDVMVRVADAAPARREFAVSRGARDAVSDVEALAECDGYVIASPARTQRAVAERLLARGAPVFLEKPPCNNITDVRALVGVGGDRLYVMHKWRYHPGVLAARDLLQSGSLGVPVRLETIRTGPERLPAGVDVTWHLASHDLSIALEVLGSVPEVRAATGETRADDRIWRCDATPEGESGAEHHLLVGAGVPNQQRSMRLVGSDRSVWLTDGYASHVVLVDDSGSESVQPVKGELPLDRELHTFVEFVNGGPPPKSTGADALAVCEELAKIDVLVRGTC